MPPASGPRPPRASRRGGGRRGRPGRRAQAPPLRSGHGRGPLSRAVGPAVLEALAHSAATLPRALKRRARCLIPAFTLGASTGTCPQRRNGGGTMHGYDVVTRDDDKVGHVVGEHGDYLIVEHGTSSRQARDLRASFVHPSTSRADLHRRSRATCSTTDRGSTVTSSRRLATAVSSEHRGSRRPRGTAHDRGPRRPTPTTRMSRSARHDAGAAGHRHRDTARSATRVGQEPTRSDGLPRRAEPKGRLTECGLAEARLGEPRAARPATVRSSSQARDLAHQVRVRRLEARRGLERDASRIDAALAADAAHLDRLGHGRHLGRLPTAPRGPLQTSCRGSPAAAPPRSLRVEPGERLLGSSPSGAR